MVESYVLRGATKAAAAEAAPRAGPICRVCGETANTIRDGKSYCGEHHEGHAPNVPVTVCKIDGCGCPAAAKVGGRDLCREHAAWAGFGRVA